MSSLLAAFSQALCTEVQMTVNSSLSSSHAPKRTAPMIQIFVPSKCIYASNADWYCLGILGISRLGRRNYNHIPAWSIPVDGDSDRGH